MKRTSSNLWYTHDNRWKLERQDKVGVLTRVTPDRILDEEPATRTFTRFEDALAELRRIEGVCFYDDQWLTYLRKLETKGGPKPEVVAIRVTCLACHGRGTNIDMRKVLAHPLVTCPRCAGSGEETVETAK